MGLGFSRTLSTGGKTVFQGHGGDIQLAQGGFGLDITGLPLGALIRQGTPMNFDETTRVAKVLKTAKVVETAGGSATAYKVEKGHLFATSDVVSKTVGGASYTITGAIDTSNADYDVINVTTTLGAAAVGDVLFHSAASGASAGALKVEPKGLLYEEKVVSAAEGASIAIRATVYENLAPSANSEIKAAMPHIIYSKSY